VPGLGLGAGLAVGVGTLGSGVGEGGIAPLTVVLPQPVTASSTRKSKKHPTQDLPEPILKALLLADLAIEAKIDNFGVLAYGDAEAVMGGCKKRLFLR
jgi:hypothetical protein